MSTDRAQTSTTRTSSVLLALFQLTNGKLRLRDRKKKCTVKEKLDPKILQNHMTKMFFQPGVVASEIFLFQLNFERIYQIPAKAKLLSMLLSIYKLGYSGRGWT